MKTRFGILTLSLYVLTAVLFCNLTAQAAPVRIKDIADIEGIRENMLIGYGLVVGLNGTGDSANGIPFTKQTLVNMLERLGVNSRDVADQLKTKNVAAVMVTARMPSLARQGSKLDITVSSLGDAKSLEGGLLLATPLTAADGETYAVAQGSIVVGGFTAEGNAGSINKNHPTVGRVADGAVVERETGFELADLGTTMRLILRSPDFTTATRTAEVINKVLGANSSTAIDNATIDIALPVSATTNVVTALHTIENLRVEPASKARIIIDEKTGTIVMGEDVRISNVAISHANLVIKVQEEFDASQPNFTFNLAGETVVLPRTSIEVEVDDNPDHGKFEILDGGASLAELVKGLNALGVKPRDVISILQNIKAAGAIQAELEVL